MVLAKLTNHTRITLYNSVLLYKLLHKCSNTERAKGTAWFLGAFSMVTILIFRKKMKVNTYWVL